MRIMGTIDWGTSARTTMIAATKNGAASGSNRIGSVVARVETQTPDFEMNKGEGVGNDNDAHKSGIQAGPVLDILN